MGGCRGTERGAAAKLATSGLDGDNAYLEIGQCYLLTLPAECAACEFVNEDADVTRSIIMRAIETKYMQSTYRLTS